MHKKRAATSGGKLPFLTGELIKTGSLANGGQFSRFESLRIPLNSNHLSGKEGWLAPACALTESKPLAHAGS